MHYGWTTLHLKRIVAITTPTNQASITLLERLGMRFEKIITQPDHAGENKLFAASAPDRKKG
jgi:ribosomal-protein-alanine N-acetyltransferase